ncbi:hypothetical protein [uncultured Eubacterium sp.]|uniref:hypothetical protein n=1 Tax=uncultured Eubacterium sp. TaxID=165185 RepID=UPI0025D849D4|nr:hypothetical protein [uncultured Eubacterium sp.]
MNVPFDETVKRFQTKSNVSYTEQDMKRWQNEKDLPGFDNEKIISKNMSANDTLKMILRIVLKITRLSIAMLFVLYNYDIIIKLSVLLTRARSGMVICVPYGNGNKTSTGFWEDSTRLPEYYNGTYEHLKAWELKKFDGCSKF